MTIDEAIKHAEEVAEEKEIDAENQDPLFPNDIEECKKCAEEHRQLAEWLKDYKRLKEQEPCDDAISRQAALDEAFEVDTKEYGKIEVVGIDAINALPPVTPHQNIGCEGCIYEKTGTNSTYPCSHCGRCYTDKYKSEGSER